MHPHVGEGWANRGFLGAHYSEVSQLRHRCKSPLAFHVETSGGAATGQPSSTEPRENFRIGSQNSSASHQRKASTIARKV
jgi:hypothetical protein